MTFPLLSPAIVLASKTLITILVLLILSNKGATARTIQSPCYADITKFPDMEFVSSQHEKKLYFISKIVQKPHRDVDAFEETCQGLLKLPFSTVNGLGEIKTKSQYDFVANFVNTSLPAGGNNPSNVTWSMLGIRTPTGNQTSDLRYLLTDTPFASVFQEPSTRASFWAIRSGSPGNYIRYPDWHRNDTCLFMDWSHPNDDGRFADGCCHHREEGFDCFETRYICQIECPPFNPDHPPSGQRSVHGGGGDGGVAASTIVGCLLGLLHYLHYTCSI